MFASRDDKLALVSTIPLFGGLSRRQLREVTRLLDLTDVEAGRTLTREGERGREFFVIVEGEAQVLRDGRETALLGAGEIVGEMALLGDAPRSATVVAATRMRLLVGERRAFAPLLAADPDLAAAVRARASVREERNAA